jgi:hypothetical protein
MNQRFDARCAVDAKIRSRTGPKARDPRRWQTAGGEKGRKLQREEEGPDGAGEKGEREEEEAEGADEVVKDFEGFGCGRHGDTVLRISSDARICVADGR